MKGKRLTQLRHNLDRPPVYLADFYQHHTAHHKFEIFLCGGEVAPKHVDPRINLRELIRKRFGCVAYLGEDRAKELERKPKLDRDLLTIEVDWANKADLIIMFLGSAGTVSEVTAFAMSPTINSKLLVFNDAQFKGAKSFINQGPLRLLKSNQIYYYDPLRGVVDPEVFGRLDRGISQAVHEKLYTADRRVKSFEYVSTLCMISALYPVGYEELVHRMHMSEKSLLRVLRELFSDGLVVKIGKPGAYVPTVGAEKLPIPKKMISDVAKARCRVFADKVNEENFDAVYSRIHRQLRGAGRFRTA